MSLVTSTPQECPACKVSLVDRSVPPEYADYQDQFTMATSRRLEDKTEVWMCPVCKHEWPREIASRKMKRAAQKGLRKRMRRNR